MQIQPTEAQLQAVTRLESAIHLQSGALAEKAVSEAFAVGLHPLYAQYLIFLAEVPWHSRHEDVVLALQRLRSPAAVGALERTAHAVHAYLAYDDGLALARKCTWALADIGTPEAHQALVRLSNCENAIIAGFARKRLNNWQRELKRKGL
jgi:hypothetical protein